MEDPFSHLQTRKPNETVQSGEREPESLPPSIEPSTFPLSIPDVNSIGEVNHSQ